MISRVADDRWPAPAKLNLMLRVTGRRADGYHLLQTVFQFVEVCDWLSFDVRSDGKIQRDAALEGVPDEQDLCLRAARLLQAESGTGLGVDIGLDKRLPMGGGLGGGSSDAATTLVALNHLWGLGLPMERLRQLGLTLGADVPIFIFGSAAWAEGVGEELLPLQPPSPWYLVLIPDVHVSTAKVFCDPDLTRDSPQITIRDFLAGGGGNDCVPVVRRRYPQVASALDWLDQFAPAKLTGTGGCVFAAFDSEDEARRVAALTPKAYQALVTRGINRSPLLDRLEQT